MAQEAARHMASRGSGSIINVASTAGLRAAGRLARYAASKAALIHLTQTMALELASKGVRVDALAPGNLQTDMHAEFEEAGFEDHIRQGIPMRRFDGPADLNGPRVPGCSVVPPRIGTPGERLSPSRAR